MLLCRYDAAEVFVAPMAARSPREFWGRRWNMTFRNTSHRLIFAPLQAQSPVLAGALVFLWSAALHEYLVIASLRTSTGEMGAFFVIHGIAALLDTRFRARAPLPKAMGIGLHWLWMWCTSPLFFAPLLAIVPIPRISW